MGWISQTVLYSGASHLNVAEVGAAATFVNQPNKTKRSVGARMRFSFDVSDYLTNTLWHFFRNRSIVFSHVIFLFLFLNWRSYSVKMERNDRKTNSRTQTHSITVERDSKFVLRKIITDSIVLFCGKFHCDINFRRTYVPI